MPLATLHMGILGISLVSQTDRSFRVDVLTDNSIVRASNHDKTCQYSSQCHNMVYGSGTTGSQPQKVANSQNTEMVETTCFYILKNKAYIF